MADINVAFSRAVLKITTGDIKRVTSAAERKAAWVYKSSSSRRWRDWEFHGPDSYYWYGTADNAYDARAKGWSAWLTKLEANGDALRARLAAQREQKQK